MKRALVLLAIVFMTVLEFGGGGAAAAAGSATLVLHVRQCPPGEPQTDIFADCHAYPASRSDRFDVEAGGSKLIDRTGNATFRGLSAGAHLVLQTAGQYRNEFLNERIWCSTNGGAAKELNVDSWGDFAVRLTASATTNCDVYFIPVSGGGDGTPAGLVAYPMGRVFTTQPGALGRSGPSRSDGVVWTYDAGTQILCDGYVHGQAIDGDDRWLHCGFAYVHSSGVFEDV